MPSLKEIFSFSINEDIESFEQENKPKKQPDLKVKMGPHLPKAIVEKSNGRLRFGGKKAGAYRIQRTDPDVGVPSHELQAIFNDLDFSVIEILPPGTPGAASGKFNTYIMRYCGLEFSIVFGQGRNGGQKYEDQVLDDLKSSQKDKDKQSELYKALLNAFQNSQDEIKEIKKVASRFVKRPVTDEIMDVGSIVSDIDIVLNDGKIIHISLKDINGSTFANSGYTGGFVKTLGDDGKPLFDDGFHELDKFLSACGVNKEKAAQGLNDYVRKEPTNPPFRDVPTNFEPVTISKYLASAYGYGYWYVRPNRTSRGGGYQIVHIDSPEAAMNKVGNVNFVTVTYPYWTPKMKSKQITIKIDTDTAFYKIEIRNSHRKVMPNEFKIKIEGLKA